MIMATFAARRLQPMIAQHGAHPRHRAARRRAGHRVPAAADELARAGAAHALLRARCPAMPTATATWRPTSSARTTLVQPTASLPRILRTPARACPHCGPGMSRRIDPSILERGDAIMKKHLLALLARRRWPCRHGARRRKPRSPIGISGWTGFAPLTLAKEAGLFKKNGLDVRHQEDPAEGPPPGDRLGRHPVRGDDGRDLDRLERQRRRHHADLPARQELWRRRHGRQAQHHQDQRPEGQDRGRQRARHRAVLHAGLDAEEERPVA